ncbi:MAG: FAD-dependent oxidoreductase [Lentisphaeria bacterium]|nr:FAD-dependent oxidoreductase [Lentisphaeria bacterium]
MLRERTNIVCGSGAGGLTLALLLARSGRPVTLIESQPEIGGYLRRFYRNGIPFDTGYHFSGGFSPGGIMEQMMQVLGLSDAVSGTPIPNRIVLAESGKEILLPAECGHSGAAEICCSAFPDDAEKIREFFRIEQEIWDTTPMHDLHDLTPLTPDFSRYDLSTAEEICQSLGLSPAATACTGSFAMCHGTPLSEAPMSFHARVGYALHADLARPTDGGDAMIRAFKREAAKSGIDIRTGTELLKFSAPDADGACHKAHLSDGTILDAEQVFFTTHPFAIQNVLPDEARTPSHERRIRRLKESCSFFCTYFTADEAMPDGLVSYFSGNDIDHILTDGTRAHSTGILFNRERDRAGVLRHTVSAFRTMRFEGMPQPFSPDHRQRLTDEAYQSFKAQMIRETEAEIERVYPALKGKLHVQASGSPWTCLDYDPPTGSAYGARCICGQARICGQLPVTNFFAAGQSALVPGVMGTMLASFSVFRQVLGEDVYTGLLRRFL